MTPLDYDYLRKCLKQQSGLALSADKHYLVESRLLSLARNAGLRPSPNLYEFSKPAAMRASWPP